MKKINTLRANLMYNIFKTTQCDIVVSSMVQALLKQSPSYSEISKCEVCKESNENSFELLYLNNETFGNDFANLSAAIDKNFEKESSCGYCGTIKRIQQEFKSHLFIEVENLKLSRFTHAKNGSSIFFIDSKL